MRKIHKIVENNIEYLVLESTDSFFINNYINKYKSPSGYENMKYIKHIQYSGDCRIDTNYFYCFLQHNLYSFAFTRQFTFKLGYNFAESYYILGKKYSKEDWKKKSKIMLRNKKINKIRNIIL